MIVIRTTAAVLTLLLTMSLAYAGGLGQEAAMIGHSTLSPFGIDLPDAVTPMTTTANPAVISLVSPPGISNLAEIDLGQISFDDGPRAIADMETVILNRGNDTYRLMRYGISSAARPMPLVLPPDLEVEMTGSAYQLAYARNFGNASVGLSWFPADQTITRVTSLGQPVMTATARASFAGRVGATYAISDQLVLGGYYHFERDKATMDSPDFTSSSTFTSKSTTLGAGWAPRLGTNLAVNYQTLTVSGDNLDYDSQIWYYALTQYLTPEWSACVSNLDSAWGISVSWYGRNANAGLSWSPESFRSSADYLGTADTVYFWAAISF